MARYEVVGIFPIRNKKREDVGQGGVIEDFPEGTNVRALVDAGLIKELPEKKVQDDKPEDDKPRAKGAKGDKGE